MSDITPTRGAALALKDERQLISMGYEFLDEKRMLLAATILAELKGLRAAEAAYREAMAQAIDALKRAVSRHGLEGVQLYPTTLSDAGTVTVTTTNFLGTLLAEARDVAQETPAPLAAVDGSPEAEACRALFAALIPLAAAFGAKSGNVARLIREYRGTERRARALENVLLPEITTQLAEITNSLEEADLEEMIRIRSAAR